MFPFHLAIPVIDIESTEQFYTEQLGCDIGRRSDRWIDFNFFGHQLSAHVNPEATGKTDTNPVDGEQVPVRHFGIVLGWTEWHDLRDSLLNNQTGFLIKPTIRFKGEVGEQATMFLCDPSGNALEFKSFRSAEQLFARD